MITNKIPGGNIQVVSVEGHRIELDVEMRDSSGDWFYWCFKVKFPEKGLYRFRFTRGGKVGTRGPAVSRDGGKSWSRDWNREQNQECGEFMMRLKLSSVGEQGTAEWTAGHGIVGDPEQLFAYAADEGELFRLELRRHWDESRCLRPYHRHDLRRWRPVFLFLG